MNALIVGDLAVACLEGDGEERLEVQPLDEHLDDARVVLDTAILLE